MTDPTPPSEAAKAFAARLNGREIGEEISPAEANEAESLGLLIVFGYSDDNTEFRGVMDDELGAWEGREFVICRRSDGELFVPEQRRDHDGLLRAGWKPPETRRVLTVTAEWDPHPRDPSKPECSWLITSDAPFAPFDIMEDGELFCRGAVIDVPGEPHD